MKKGFLCCILSVILLMSMGMMASAQTVSLTSVSFANDNAVAEENLSLSGYGDKDSGYAASTVGGRIFASVSGTDLRKLEWSKGEYAGVGMQPAMTGGTKNPWGNSAYLEVRLSTAGYENITFSAQIGATNKGPRDYKLQYSTDGSAFHDVAGAFYTLTTNKTMFDAFENVALPAAASNAETLYIRITVASNMMVNGTAGLVGSTGGETAINNVSVSGTPLATQATQTTTSSASKAETTSVSQNAVVTTISSESTQADATTTALAKETTTIPNVRTDDIGVASAAFVVTLIALTVIGVAAKKRRKA